MATLQDPEAVPPGVVRGGVGASWVGTYGPHFEGSARVGVVRRLDLGAKVASLAADDILRYLIYYGDARYQPLTGTVQLTIGCGVSRYAVHSLETQKNEYLTTTIQPFVTVGYKPLYLAVRPFYARRAGRLRDASPDLVFRDNRWDLLGLTVGAALPIRRSRVLLELNNMLFHHGRTIFIPAIGLQTDL